MTPGALTRQLLAVLVFLIVFMTKLHGVIDVPVFCMVVFALWYALVAEIPVTPVVAALCGTLLCLAVYAGVISFLYGYEELIWFFKFLRTSMIFLLVYVFSLYANKVNDYERFKSIIVWCVLLHSFIIYLAILSPEFRHSLYAFTGYEPRGPEWSRSPGLTISFNTPAIVHLTALWFLFNKCPRALKLARPLLIVLIIPSLMFLGRTVSYVGVLAILGYFTWRHWRRVLPLAALAALLISLGSVTVSYQRGEIDEDTTAGVLAANWDHLVGPLFQDKDEDGEKVGSYYKDYLGDHIYFSERAGVLLFGNSRSGHVGLAGGGGETHSDIGFINSVNANGILVTLAMYLFYLALVYLCRGKDWHTVLFVVCLAFVLTFKETGFFDSHATPLLFMIFFYQDPRL